MAFYRSYTLSNYTLSIIFFKVDCFYDVLLYKIQHLLLTIYFSIAPVWTNSEFNFDCLQSAFSLTIRPVLTPVRAIANDVAPSRAWVTSIVNLQWTRRLHKIFQRPRYMFKHFFFQKTHIFHLLTPSTAFKKNWIFLLFCNIICLQIGEWKN